MSTLILLCKFSASGDGKGTIPSLTRYFFKLFGVQLLLDPKSLKKYRSSLDRYSPSPCQLFLARKISINI
jgi:hypothetical protein